jgi:LPXTG-motif cell wall-anchored protein
MRALAVAALAGAVISLISGPAAFAADAKATITALATADKTAYAETDTFTVTVKVTNTSSVDAKHVHYIGGDNESVKDVVWGAISTGFDLAAHETKSLPITGKFEHSAWTHGYGGIAFSLGADNIDGEGAVTGVQLNVPGAFTRFSGVIFQGESVSSPYEPGKTPGVPGVVVTAKTDDGKTVLGQATTGADGSFKFAHLPAGIARLSFEAPRGWKVLSGENGDGSPEQVQVIAEQADLPTVFIVAKQVPVPSDSPSPSPSVSVSPSHGPALPVTGSNTTLLAVAGVVAVAVGIGLVLIARRRRVRLEI